MFSIHFKYYPATCPVIIVTEHSIYINIYQSKFFYFLVNCPSSTAYYKTVNKFNCLRNGRLEDFMSDLAATNCGGCGSGENGCSWIIILLLLCSCCGGGNGFGFGGGCGGESGCGSIIWILLLLCCCGGGNGFC